MLGVWHPTESCDRRSLSIDDLWLIAQISLRMGIRVRPCCRADTATLHTFIDRQYKNKAWENVIVIYPAEGSAAYFAAARSADNIVRTSF